ncbi:hypothetical protein PVAP13_7KG361701 [Panicum virgatum]|uniref:Uncharacterized protein n=1 Tax=Panicum virgatum TaxID=38727 RepID=A0A8T0QS66_PANVG|nr:hypothetical protein PVAP13_7KG361701 [Panicum virgatum]
MTMLRRTEYKKLKKETVVLFFLATTQHVLLAAALPFIPVMDKLLLYPISEQGCRE